VTIITVSGLKELQQRLVAIGAVSGTKAMRSSMFTATKPIIDKAKATVPVRSGALRQSITRSFSVKNNGGSVFFGDGAGSRFTINVGPRVRNRTAVALYNLVYKLKHPIRGIFYGHFIEFGTASGTKATHWLRNALESTADAAVELLASTLKKRIETTAKK
jgi:HK97 gp10 family phage protein